MNTNINSKIGVIQSITLSILINGIIPLIVYSMLIRYYSTKSALIIATIIPLIDNLYHIFKDKKVDEFAMFMLLGFVLSILVLFLGGNEKIILLRESLVTGLLGLVFTASLLFPKPLIYYFAIRFQTNNSPLEKSVFKERWNVPYFRFVTRLMTAVWGIALLGEAVIKVFLVFKLSIPMYLAISQFVFYGVIGITILWTILYKKHAKKHFDTLLENRNKG